MTGAMFADFLEIIGQRKVSGKLQDAILIDNHGAVMAGRMRIENTKNQLFGNYSIQDNATFKEGGNLVFALDNNQGADFLSGHNGARVDNF